MSVLFITGLTGTPNARTVNINNLSQITSDVTGRTSQAIVQAATQNASTFLAGYKIDSAPNPSIVNDTYTNINQFVTDFLTSTEGTVDITSATAPQHNKDIVNTYLPYLENTYLPVLQFVRQSLAESQTPDYTQLKEQRSVTDEAKSRAESIRVPEQRVSYYESWFPLVRPISEPGLFALFGIGLLFMFVAIGFFLRLSGVEFQLILPTLFESSYDGGGGMTRYLYIGMILGVIVGLLVYAYYERGWFGGKVKKQ